MAEGLLLIAVALILGTVVALIRGRRRENAWAAGRIEILSQSRSSPAPNRVDLQALGALPPPVARYFRHVLSDGQGLIAAAHLQQRGELRLGPDQSRWFAFRAQQRVFPLAPGFLWDARVMLPFGPGLRVLDSYGGGTGAGRASLLSAFVLAMDSGGEALNAAELLRYLAEGPWFPTALLPQSGVVWRAIDDHAARASLSDGDTTVSLEFRFNETGEITGIFTPARSCRLRGGSEPLPWEGHFSDYQIHAGMRIPRYGEVGWHRGGRLELVWKGRLEAVSYQLASSTRAGED